MNPAVHEHRLRVRYEETDQMGVVYYANYLVYFEVGRTEYMRARGMPYSQMERDGHFLTITETGCRHVGPLRYDDEAIIETWVSELRKNRLTFRYRVSRPEGDTRVLAAEGFTTLSCLDREGKPRRIPPRVRSLVDVMQR